MASIRKRLSKWQAQVRRQGFPAQIKSFTKREDAVRWARQQELQLDRGIVDPHAKFRDMPLAAILNRYKSEIAPTKRSKESQIFHTRQILRHPMSYLPILKIGSEQVARFRDDRLKQVSAPTVRKEVSLLGTILEIAIREWGLKGFDNPVRTVKKPPNGLARERRLNSEEQLRFDEALNLCRNATVIAVIKFAKATAMRRSEILGLKWTDVDLTNCTARLAMTKNGAPRIVPLSPTALDILNTLSPTKADGLIFPISPNALRLAFVRVCKRAAVEDFHFHDLRHESISHFFEKGLSVVEVASISGHRDLRMLNRYVHLRPRDISKKLHDLYVKETQFK